MKLSQNTDPAYASVHVFNLNYLNSSACWAFVVATVPIWFCLFLYFKAGIPSEYGINLHPCFCLQMRSETYIEEVYVNNLYDDVRDGVLLCKVINKLASELKNDFNCNIKLLKCSFEFEVSYLIFKTNIFLLTVFYQFLVPQQSCFEP